MSNSGFDNVKLQVLDWFSLDKKIKRAKFSLYTLPVIIALLFYINFFPRIFVSNLAGISLDLDGIMEIFAVLLGNLFGLAIPFGLLGIIVIFSIRRLNDLQLPKKLSLLFCGAMLFISISGFANYPLHEFKFGGLDLEIDTIAGIFSVLSVLFLLVLCFIKGIDETKK